jgi:hypothetical protein
MVVAAEATAPGWEQQKYGAFKNGISRIGLERRFSAQAIPVLKALRILAIDGARRPNFFGGR